MPEIQYPTNPNSDTAFVVQEDGTKNRALMTAPQDTSTLELPSNANSTKGYVTIDGKKQRVILTADIGGGGGGGSVDYSKTVQKTSSMPVASADNAGQVYMYTGATDANFTQNYIYKNVKTATYTGTVSFEAATLSGTTVACSGDNFANFLTESGVEPLSVVSGTMTYDSASALWVLVGKDSDGNTVLAFQEYQQDFVDAGFTFTGTPQDSDVVAFTCTVEEASATYAWTRVDVQPAGATYTAGTGISIDANNEISVTDPVLVNNGKSTGIAIGQITSAVGGAFAGAFRASAAGSDSIAIGIRAKATANNTIQLSCYSNGGTNSDANTFKVANANGNFEIMSADGTIPEARLADTTNAQQGDVLTLDSTGNAVWQAGGGGGGSYTAGTGIDITNDVISVQNPVAVSSLGSVAAVPGVSSSSLYSIGSVHIGNRTDTSSNGSVSVGQDANGGDSGVAVGSNATSSFGGISLGYDSSGAGGKFHIALSESDPTTYAIVTHQYDLVNIDGTIPADRIAPTTGLADGNYRLRLVMASGVPTLEWVAE